MQLEEEQAELLREQVLFLVLHSASFEACPGPRATSCSRCFIPEHFIVQALCNCSAGGSTNGKSSVAHCAAVVVGVGRK